MAGMASAGLTINAAEKPRMFYLKFVNFKYSILKPGPGGVVGSTAIYSLSDI